MLQATLLANWSRCNSDKAHCTFSFPTCAVVHEKYSWAILYKDKLIKFRSSKNPTILDAYNCLQFALFMRHGRRGKDDLILARVLSVEVLEVSEASTI